MHTLKDFLFDIDYNNEFSTIQAAKLLKYDKHFRHEPALERGIRGLRWVRMHQKLFADHRVPWVQPVYHRRFCGPCGYAGYEHLEGTDGEYSLLSDRQKHLNLFLDKAYPLSASGCRVQISDVSQNCTYILPIKYGCCPCIAAGSQMLRREHGKPPRMLTPRELLMLQGIPRACDTSGNSNRELVSLAGNAFCTASALPVVLATLIHYPLHGNYA